MTKLTVAKKATRPSNDPIVTEGSGNRFADLGFAHPELNLAKFRLVMERRVLSTRAISRRPKLNGHWKSYSVDRLTLYLNKLGVTVPSPWREIGRPSGKVVSSWPSRDKGAHMCLLPLWEKDTQAWRATASVAGVG